MEFQVGDKVVLRESPRGEFFTIYHTADPKFWIGDEQHRGWYVYASQIQLVEAVDEDE